MTIVEKHQISLRKYNIRATLTTTADAEIIAASEDEAKRIAENMFSMGIPPFELKDFEYHSVRFEGNSY